MTARAALAAAQRGSRAWRTVVATQGATAPEQHGFHVLAGELVDTLRALDLVTGVLLRQVHSNGDDLLPATGQQTEQAARLVAVAGLLADLHCALGHADRAASGFCSQVERCTTEVA